MRLTLKVLSSIGKSIRCIQCSSIYSTFGRCKTIVPTNVKSSIAYLHYQQSYAINWTRNLSDSITTVACWKCNFQSRERKDHFFCTKCGCLQDVGKNLDYFKLFNLSGKFNFDSIELTKTFRQLQTLVHPDKFSNSSEKEQTNSLDWSSLLNKAYRTLTATIERGEYMLQQNGIEIPEDNSSLDKEFLLEIMDRNEEVENAANIESILNLLDKVRSDLNAETISLGEKFDTKDLPSAKAVLIKMKYLKSLEKSIKDKAVQLGAVK